MPELRPDSLRKKSRGWRIGLRVAAVLCLVLAFGVGIFIARITGRVLFTAGDCLPPLGYTGGGFRCYTTGHPYAPLGHVIELAGVVLFVTLWLVSNRNRRHESALRSPTPSG